ncbi:MAG: thiolase family protein [Deltaproteobacteria bacterium]|nr:thiolase family protein [Deltaproteobacteria bacterium]
MRDVAVIGIGQSAFGKFPWRTAADLGADAVRAAFSDCGISPKAIEVAYCARAFDASCTAQDVLKEVGIRGIEMINVENACAGGATSLRGLWKEIADGRHDVGIAVGVESMTTSPIAGKLIPPEKSDIEGHLGLTMPAMFGMVARRQMAQGARIEDFAQVSVKNHHNGCLNPQAQYKKEFSVEDVLQSRMICDPITLLMCCPNTDGAAAVILCSMDVAKRYTTQPIRIMASALCSADYKYTQEDICLSPVGQKVATMAYEMAGVEPKDIDLVEMHDAFANEEILRYEDLMLCEPGEGIRLLRSGATALGGRIPVNPSGGLLALGHPLSASGIRTVCEIVLHLRGQAGARQVPGATVGLAQMLGGLVSNLEHGTVAGVHILAR